MTETDAEGSGERPTSPYEDHFQEHFALWDKYEEAAKHFNDLTMRWRLQVMGGLVTLVTVGGFVVGDIATVASRYRAMAMLSSTLLFAWVGVAILDLLYYTQLPHGAADALGARGAACCFSECVSSSARVPGGTDMGWRAASGSRRR